jgi:hypothetical protein
MGRRLAPVLVLAAMAATVLVTTGAHATTAEDSFVSRINAERSSRGIRTVVVRSDLVEVARRWSQSMADAGQISHDPNMPNEVSGWTALGDNVGRGPSVSSIHQAFMGSPEHCSIILDPDYNQVGVGVVSSGDQLYVTEVFVKRASSATTTATKTDTRKRTSSATQRVVRQTGPSSYVIVLSDVIFEIDLAAPQVTMLERLVGLDAVRVDPATGAPR